MDDICSKSREARNSFDKRWPTYRVMKKRIYAGHTVGRLQGLTLDILCQGKYGPDLHIRQIQVSKHYVFPFKQTEHQFIVQVHSVHEGHPYIRWVAHCLLCIHDALNNWSVKCVHFCSIICINCERQLSGKCYRFLDCPQTPFIFYLSACCSYKL